MEEIPLHLQAPDLPEHCPKCSRLTKGEPFCDCGHDLHFGTIKKMKSGKCAYCTHEGKLSAEHIFGDWIRRRYNRPFQTRRLNMVRSRQKDLRKHPADLARNTEVSRKAQPYSTTVFNVCEVCNNTWMSDLHRAAMPIVSRLADGYWPELSPEEAFVLSRWVAMVVINIECQGRIEVISDYQKEELKNGNMPKGWRISVGRLQHSDKSGNTHHRVLKPLGLSVHHTTQITYFCVENVAFHATSTFGDRILASLHYAGVPKKFFPRQIWPTCDKKRASKGIYMDPSLLDYWQQNCESPYDLPE